MSYSEITNSPLCSFAITPQLFGYIKEVDADDFRLSLDVRALVTSLAVNVGILQLDDIEVISNSRMSFPYVRDNQTVQVNVSSYYDPRYPDMDYITCLMDNVGIPNACIAKFGSVIALPIFHHRGTSDIWPDFCVCEDLNMEELESPRHPCNVFSFISGLLFYNTDDPVPLLELALKYSLFDIFVLSFNPMFASSAFGTFSPYSSYLNSYSTLNDMYSFCLNEDFGYCSFLTFTAWDEFSTNYAVNEYYYQLPRGACRDTISTSDENWSVHQYN
jgi:hypothetical protein